MALIEEASKAARLLLDHAYVRIVSRTDPDACAATCVLAHTLRRERVDFHITWLPRLSAAAVESLAAEKPDAVVLIGLSGDAAEHAEVGASRIVLDAVPATVDADATLDAAHTSETHPDLSLGTLAHLVGVAVSKRNVDLAPLALAGAYAMHDHVGGLRGLDAEILEETLDEGIIERTGTLNLQGATVLQALSQSDAPYISGVTGRARNVKRLAAGLGLTLDGPVSGIQGETATALGSFLTLRLLDQGAPDAALDALFAPRMRALQGPHTGLELADIGRSLEAACAAGLPGLGFASAWPDPSAAAERIATSARLREESVATLLRAEREARRDGSLVIFDAPEALTCEALAARAAIAFTPLGSIAVARHAAPDGTTLAFRAFGKEAPAIGRALRHAAAATGSSVIPRARRGRAFVEPADEGRFLKAFAEGIA